MIFFKNNLPLLAALAGSLLLATTGCQSQSAPFTAPRFPYQTDTPQATFALPDVLKEVSGITGAPVPGQLLAIQDERGVLYALAAHDGAVIDSTWFWKPGDYEDLTCVNDTIYIVKSSGTIYRLTQTQADTARADKFNTTLSTDFDVEGLCYDPAAQRLLLACKAQPGDLARQARSIYAFSLADHTLSPEPVALIRRDAVEAFVQGCSNCPQRDKFLEDFNPLADDFHFNPSAIAIHPLSGHWYVLSSVGKLLLVIQPDGTIVNLIKLRKQFHPQPEGLWFDANANLYISNEGNANTPGQIHRFQYEPSGR